MYPFARSLSASGSVVALWLATVLSVQMGVQAQTPQKMTVKRGNAPCLAWFSESQTPPPIKGILLCVHGLGLHNGTWEPFGRAMAEAGYPCYAIDVRGFGSWMEAKGRETVDFEGCLSDVQQTLKVIHRAHPGLPVFIVGESMGGAIALRIASLYPDLVSGLVSSVPAGDRFKQGKTTFKVALQYLKGADKPFDVGSGVIKQATLKPELRQAWASDPLARLNLSPKELIQFQSFMDQNHECAKKVVDRPVLFVQGVDDKLVKPAGTEELFEELGTNDRQLYLVKGGEHLIFEENQFNQETIAYLTSWLDAHL